MGPFAFATAFDNPITGKTDHLMKGPYVRTTAGGRVIGRAVTGWRRNETFVDFTTGDTASRELIIVYRSESIELHYGNV